MEALTQLITSLILFVGFWIYCRRASTRGKLAERWYMWLWAFVCGQLAGLVVYIYYLKRQARRARHAAIPISN